MSSGECEVDGVSEGEAGGSGVTIYHRWAPAMGSCDESSLCRV
jgi:hypothetical protein